MVLDPDIQVVLDRLVELGSSKLEDMSVEVARSQFRALIALDGQAEAVDAVEDGMAPGGSGDVAIRTYRPADAPDGPLPVLVWFHGGGFVIGGLDTADPTARKLANRTGAVVVSVAYRLAPEHRFPAAVDDAWTVTQWLADHADDVDGDGSRLALGGDSAGGNLATVTAQRAAAAGLEVRAQALVCPMTDLRMGTPSYRDDPATHILTAGGMRWFIEHYLGPDGDPTDPRGSPILAADLVGMAPATIVTTEHDPLRDEGIAYADRLEAEGVDAHHLHYDGMVHGFVALGTITSRAGEMLRALGHDLRERLG